MDSKGTLLSAIDGSHHVDPALWKRRAEMGPGVYSYPENEPGILLVNDKMVARLNPPGPLGRTWRKLGDAKEILKTPDDLQVATMYHSKYRGEEVTVPFWDVIGGVFTPGDGEFYLRLQGEKNPAQQDVDIAPDGATVEIHGAQHVIVRNLIIKGGEYGVIIGEKGAQGNILEKCYIPHGRFRIQINDGAHNTIIRDNKIEMGFIGHATGAWGEGYGKQITTPEESAQAAQREFLYNYFKHFPSAKRASQDYSIRTEYDAKDIDNLFIENNLLDGGLIGINISTPAAGNFFVRNNIVRNFSSTGTTITDGTYRLIEDGNLFANNDINIRIHNLGNKGKRDVYILRNTLLLPIGIGKHIHNHTYSRAGSTSGKEYLDEHVTIYHNNFIGGEQTMSLGVFRDAQKNISENELNLYRYFRVINNTFINCGAVVGGSKEFNSDPTRFGAFDYNLIIGGHFNRLGKPAWWGSHNVMDEKITRDWKWDMNGFTAPSDTAKRAIGIDVSKPFTINGKTYDPLPELKPGYFKGEKPLTGWPQ